MTRLFWDTVVLISGYLFTFGAGPTHPAIAMNTNSIAAAAAPNTSTGGPVATGSTSTSTSTTTITTASDLHIVNDSLSTFEARQNNSFVTDAGIAVNYSASNTSGSAPTTNTTNTTTTTTTGIVPVKKFVTVAVRSHFADCPDSHRHFCIHGTCHFLILELTPACVCHAGFVGMRCEHADLLAVVATNHRRQTVATVLVLSVIGCVLVMLLCTLLHCWLQQECLRRRRAHHFILSKHGASYCPSASVV